MEGFSLNDIQALSINRNEDHNGSFRKKKELVSVLTTLVKHVFLVLTLCYIMQSQQKPFWREIPQP